MWLHLWWTRLMYPPPSGFLVNIKSQHLQWASINSVVFLLTVMAYINTIFTKVSLYCRQKHDVLCKMFCHVCCRMEACCDQLQDCHYCAVNGQLQWLWFFVRKYTSFLSPVCENLGLYWFNLCIFSRARSNVCICDWVWWDGSFHFPLVDMSLWQRY